MNILVIGGTRFVGRHFVEAALAKGHTLTLFNRGKSNADIFPNVEKIRGDRDLQADLDQLRGRKWDAVLDTCGYVPRHVTMLAETLKEAVDKYVFISTISVYKEPVEPDADENAPLNTLEEESVEEVNGETYGGLKVLCERTADAVMPDRVLHIRPGLVVGPYDPTDRFTYWVARIKRSGDVLVPGTASRRVEMIDGRDLGEWTVSMIERKATGVYNAVNPTTPLTWGEWMETTCRALDVDATFKWVDDVFLESNNVNGGELPFWAPPPYDGVFAVSNHRALEMGLGCRMLEQIVLDTWEWHQGRGADYQLRVGMSSEREAELLSLFNA
jgi:2'-hydroxyisoflavone reductase